MNAWLTRLIPAVCLAFLIGGASLTPSTASSAPPPPQARSSSQGTLDRLSPDLRSLAQAARGQGPAANAAGGALPLVTVVVKPGTQAGQYMVSSVASRVTAGFQWISGEVQPAQLEKLAALDGVQSVYSQYTFQTAEAPGLDQLRRRAPAPDAREVGRLIAAGDQADLMKLADSQRAGQKSWPALSPALLNSVQPSAGRATRPSQVHGVPAAEAMGLDGAGVTVGLVDTGVDFAHPDLQGTFARVPSGPYKGWPFAYDVNSGLRYALHPGYAVDPTDHIDRLGTTNFAATLPVPSPACGSGSCKASLAVRTAADSQIVSWPDLSKSGKYYFGILPDPNLALAAYYANLSNNIFVPPFFIVSDETTAGVYDTVYVDMNFDHILGEKDERMTQGQPLAGLDLNKDGIWDLSGGMLAWISDGINQPPGVAELYPSVSQSPAPEAGRLLVFINDEAGHGTSCAGQIAAQGVITDPNHYGVSSPLLTGPVLDGMARGARIAAFENGFNNPLDAWTLAVYGFDGQPASGDEVQIVSNSWGSSAVVDDGWDELSRFAQALNLQNDPGLGRPPAQDIAFLVATGNGGHGYGTVTAPGGGSLIEVGASTLYGPLRAFESVGLDQFLYGDISPWSNRGPGALGDLAPNISAVGAWGTGALPLNAYGQNGQLSYDVFGGTSMSTPIVAGGTALVYQAFHQQHGRWPAWQETRDLLESGAQDLGYDGAVQGSGNLRVDHSAAEALGQALSVSPAQWTAGDYHGQDVPAFAHILAAGQSAQQDFVLDNPTAQDAAVQASAGTLQRVHDEIFTIPYAPAEFQFDWSAVYLEDISALVNQYQPDLVRADLVLPYTAFDPALNYYNQSWWSVAFYDWKDLNGNGRLWLDANHNGMVDPGELDSDPVSGLSEINRFTYGYPMGDTVQASLGRESLQLRHDGVFLRLNCIWCGPSANLQVRVSFYKFQDWGWLSLSPSVALAPAHAQTAVHAQLSVPPGTPPGYYEGAIHLALPDRTVNVPVTVQVAAQSGTFTFGGTPLASTPYDNGHSAAAFNWNWRYESGDWRFFYFDAPVPLDGAHQVVDLAWNSLYSDTDVFAFGQTPLAQGLEAAVFGPYGLAQGSASADAYLGNGKFRRETSTGTAREVIDGSPGGGLSMLALHQVLSGGDQFSEPFSGSVYQVSVNPTRLDLHPPASGTSAPRLQGAQTVSLTTSGAIPDGLRLQAFGFSPPIVLKNQAVRQDEGYNICSSSWIYRPDQGLLVQGGGLLDITTASAEPGLDVDLYVFLDNGDGVWNCGGDKLVYYSMAPGASENIHVNFPEDGRYWILVHGFSVPGGKTGSFDITIRAVQGGGLRIRNAPIGPLSAGQTVNLQLEYDTAYPFETAQALEGLVYAGLPGLPNLIEIPVTLRPDILLLPVPSLRASAPWVFQTPVQVSLTVHNIGASPENVQAQIQLPPGLVYVDGSADAPGAKPVYDPGAARLDWTGPVGADSDALLTFAVTAAPGFTPGPVQVQAGVLGLISGQSWQPSLALQVNRAVYYWPVIYK